MNVPDVTVTVELTGLRGEKIELPPSNLASSPVKFDINAKLEERERKSGEIMVLFALTVGTKTQRRKIRITGKSHCNG